jgi:hypothetical protein
MTFSMTNCTPSAEDVVIFLLFPAMRTPVTLLIVSLFGILFVTGCGGSVRTPVLNAQGKQVGEIDIQGQSVATIYLKGEGSGLPIHTVNKKNSYREKGLNIIL